MFGESLRGYSLRSLSATGEETVTDVLLREIRELGESVICLDQHPSLISKPALGIPWLQLVDFDIVEESNIASQGYLEEDINRMKVEATADLCRKINRNLEVHALADRFKRSMEVVNAVFVCVD